MQDKIQEFMGLVEEYKDVAIGGFSGWDERMAIESKLRELVREPLSDKVIKMIDDSTHFHESTDWPIRFARAIERAHGITNTSGVE